MRMIEGLEILAPPGKCVMAVVNETGDKKTIWDPNVQLEVDAARAEFDHFKKAGYMAYRVEGEKGNKAEVMSKFDPLASRIIFAPPMRGGCGIVTYLPGPMRARTARLWQPSIRPLREVGGDRG